LIKVLLVDDHEFAGLNVMQENPITNAPEVDL